MIYRNPDLLAAVRMLPCVMCGFTRGVQSAHSNQLRFGKGRGMKASDAAIMALCGPSYSWGGCHAFLDQGGDVAKSERDGLECLLICQTLMELIKRGKLRGDPDVMRTFPQSIDEVYAVETVAGILVDHIENGRLAVVK